jgi:histidinol-phosphate/aromatic aminotransferase/cobyric acid decarboxylase-like protein
VSPRRRLLDYYRQFEALSPEEDSRRLRERRDAERSKELERVAALDLSGTAWHEAPDPEIVNAATFALRRALNRYPDPHGGAAREAVARHHGVPADRVALGHGAGELLQAALRELAAGGEVVLPWPSWSPLPALAARAGVRPVPVRLGAGDAVDLDALAAAVGDATRAVVICSPNDPTGAVVDREALRTFVAALRPSVSVLVDEALVELAGEDASCAPLVDELPNLLVLRSFSKGWAMAGLRAGYLLGPAGDEELLAVLGPGQGVASPTLAAITAALEDPGRAARRLAARRTAAAAERERLATLLAGTPFSFAPSAAHLVWLRGEGMTAAAIAHALAGQGVLVASGAQWGDEEHVRVALRDRAATERLAAALRAAAGALATATP